MLLNMLLLSFRSTLSMNTSLPWITLYIHYAWGVVEENSTQLQHGMHCKNHLSLWFPTAPKAFSYKKGKKKKKKRQGLSCFLDTMALHVGLAYQETIQLSLCKWKPSLSSEFSLKIFLSSWILFFIFLVYAFLFLCPLCCLRLSYRVMVKQTATVLPACKFLFICKIPK